MVKYLLIIYSQQEKLSIITYSIKELQASNTETATDDSDSAEYSGKIVECSWDQDEKVWVSMRVRVDKSTPNDINTYRKVSTSYNLSLYT